MSVGQDLLDVPFPKMVLSLAQAISKGQMAMDLASLNTLKILAKTKFDWIPEVTEVLQRVKIDTVGGVDVSGVDVQLLAPRTGVQLTMIQAGILPTFYQFTESIIEFGASVEVSADFLFASGTFSSHVNYKTANKYSYSVDGSSLLRTTLKPTPPPTRLVPKFITVNTLVTPPTVTTSD